MKKYTSLIVTAISLFILILSISAPEVSAATNPGVGQALEIAPPLITLTANPGQTIKTTIQLRDITPSNLAVTNEIDDFLAAGEDGTPKILTGNDSNNPFQLKKWIAPLPAFILKPNQIENLPVSINIPRDASPGGHYGVIRFSGVPPQLKGEGVSLSASIGSLVLLTVNGHLVHKLSVNQFTTANLKNKVTKVFQSAPLNFVVKLQNSGNIQEEPEGQILVTDMFGKPVASSDINAPPRNVLPDSIRAFTGVLNQTNLGPRRLFGLYHAKLQTRYGEGYGQIVTAETTFWVIPYKLIAIIIVLLLIAFFAIRYMLQRYKRKLLGQTKSTRKTTKKQPTKPRRM